MIIKGLDKELEFDFRGSVLALLKALKLNPVEHLVIVNGELAHESKHLCGNEEVKIIRVVSGG